MNSTSEIVYAFIDSQNLFMGVKALGWELDYKKFRVYLKDKYHVSKTILFLGYIKSNQKLYNYLYKCGYEIVFKPVVKHLNGIIKGNIDAELVLHSAKIEYENYDKAIVISGDGDFYCLIEDMYREDRLYKLLIPNSKSESRLLKKFQNYKVFLNRERNLLEKIGRRGVLPRK